MLWQKNCTKNKNMFYSLSQPKDYYDVKKLLNLQFNKQKK
jgi:hypothetical protein